MLLTTIFLALATIKSAAAQAVVVQSTGVYNAVGCFRDVPAARVLKYGLFDNNRATVEGCAAYCYAARYNYMGVEYQGQCNLQPDDDLSLF